MIENSAEAVLMSGSGPTVFGVFKAKEAAEKAALDFTSENIYATVCSNLI